MKNLLNKSKIFLKNIPNFVWYELSARVIIIAIGLFIYVGLKPHKRLITKDEWHLYLHPHLYDRFGSLVMEVAIIGLCLISLIFSFFVNWRRRRLHPTIYTELRNIELFDVLMSFTLSAFINFIVNEIPKQMVGKPRPDFFNRCFPCIDLNNQTAVWEKIDSILNSENIEDRINFNCENPDNCKATERFCDDHCANFRGRRSFPSGHVATGFCCTLWFSLFCWGKLGTFQRKHKKEAWRFVPNFCLLLFMYFIGFTRVQDNRHDHEDCIFGYITGFLFAVWGYRMYYPGLTDGKSEFSYRQIDVLRRKE